MPLTTAQHYARAESLLTQLGDFDIYSPPGQAVPNVVALVIAAAQVHATLATVGPDTLPQAYLEASGPSTSNDATE
jgi:hypothetical protein